jgi:hypothetical protein
MGDAMTQDEIIELARTVSNTPLNSTSTPDLFGVNQIVNFAKLVAAKEREEIVQFIERTNLGSLSEETALHYANLLRSYSTAIRARGEA